jgi:hypothetical protein
VGAPSRAVVCHHVVALESAASSAPCPDAALDAEAIGAGGAPGTGNVTSVSSSSHTVPRPPEPP